MEPEAKEAFKLVSKFLKSKEMKRLRKEYAADDETASIYDQNYTNDVMRMILFACEHDWPTEDLSKLITYWMMLSDLKNKRLDCERYYVDHHLCDLSLKYVIESYKEGVKKYKHEPIS